MAKRSSKTAPNASATPVPAVASNVAAPADTILTGDCLDSMAKLPAACVDLIFADPPYNIGFKYDQYEDNRDDHDYVDWTFKWVDGCARLLKPTGSLYILIGDEYAAETRVHLKELERQRRLVFRNWIVWHYTFGQNCRAKFNRSHAHLFYCVGPGAFDQKFGGKGAGHGKVVLGNLPFTFNRSTVSVPSARQLVYHDLRANPSGKLPDDVWYLRPQEAIAAREDDGQGDASWLFDADGDTWYLSRLCGTFKERLGWHPCQLPEALLERIINLSSNPGDVVFDPFVGSGTTLAVAARLKRSWLGCELSEDYAEKSLARIRHAQETGTTMQSTMEDKGIERGKPKKKAEPHRSAGLF